MISLTPYTDADLSLLMALNAPELMEHLGGPESDEKIRKRHEKYVAAASSDTTNVFAIRNADGERVGSIVYWERTWRDATVYETGWSILPQHQGHGYATAAAREVITRVRDERRGRSLFAFPKTGNGASNAICRKAGFTLVGECDFEYPPGHPIRCYEWRMTF